jgi:drug/metabolite transporter (DMT)-like permease
MPSMGAITLALISSALWGLADFLGGLRSRTLPVPVVLAGMYFSSLAVMLVYVAVRGEGPPSSSHVLAALGSGLAGIVGLSAFYRGLAIGTMSIVAPIASTGVALPVLVGVLDGDRPGIVRTAGLALAIAGVVLASRETDDGVVPGADQRRSVLLAIVAGACFGSYFVLAQIGARGDVAWGLALSRVSAFPIIAVVALLALRRGGARPGRSAILALSVFGLIDLAANALYNHASTIGELSSVSVAGSLYPVSTVVLAGLVLGERVQGVQRLGIGVALTGVVLIAAGG